SIMKGLLFVLLTLPTWSFAVSRVGGGKVRSLNSGFELNVQSPFMVATLEKESVRCLGPDAITVNNGTLISLNQYFEITEFNNEFENVNSLDKEQLIHRFQDSGWSEQSSSMSCALSMRYEQDGAVAYFITWGKGKGLAIKGTDTSDTVKMIENALKTLQVPTGCEWR
ncbi:MAG: hypothetical protein J7501_05560, partial [Bdellovibrio sp.]|nr:hypothetical protein [Bdellovibrio sp.]